MHFPPAAANNEHCAYFARIRKLKKQNNDSYIFYLPMKHMGTYLRNYVVSAPISSSQKKILICTIRKYLYMYQKIFVCVVLCETKTKPGYWISGGVTTAGLLAPAPSQRTQSHTTRDITTTKYTQFYSFTLNTLFSLFLALTGHSKY